MATAAVKTQKPVRQIGPDCNGILLTPREFDRADFEDGYRYELINGVLIVSPIPSEPEADANGELGYWLRSYQASHSQGFHLDVTLPERIVKAGENRRWTDRLIWAGLGRMPRPGETPTILVEFVSSRKRDRQRDYETKRVEYMAIEVLEYWIFDRFQRCLVVFRRQGGKITRRVFHENQIYRSPLLPGFDLPLAKLLAVADRWEDTAEQESP